MTNTYCALVNLSVILPDFFWLLPDECILANHWGGGGETPPQTPPVVTPLFSTISLKYGDGLLLCRILPVKEYIDNSNCDIPQGYNSKKVLLRQPSETEAVDTSGEMIIIENSDQILPFFVINRCNRELDK